MSVTEENINIIKETLLSLDYELVRVKVTGTKTKTVQIMIDHYNQFDKDITLEDCEVASHVLSPLLDHMNLFNGHYNLEVSSPGVDRPLVKLADFERFKSFDAKITTIIKIGDKKKFSGKIIGTDGDEVLIKFYDSEDITKINFENIHSAQLILTDELINATRDKNI